MLVAVETLRKGYIRLQEDDNPRKRARLAKLISQTRSRHADARGARLQHSISVWSTSPRKRSALSTAPANSPRRRPAVGRFLRPHAAPVPRHGMNAEQLQTLLNQLAYMPVFTAHPTEAKRRTIMEALRRIFITAEELDDPRIGEEKRRDHPAPGKRDPDPVEDRRSARTSARRCATKSATAFSISRRVCSRPCRRSIATWKRRFAASTATRDIRRCRVSCASVPGSAATATATPTSSRRPRAWRCACTRAAILAYHQRITRLSLLTYSSLLVPAIGDSA